MSLLDLPLSHGPLKFLQLCLHFQRPVGLVEDIKPIWKVKQEYWRRVILEIINYANKHASLDA